MTDANVSRSSTASGAGGGGSEMRDDEDDKHDVYTFKVTYKLTFYREGTSGEQGHVHDERKAVGYVTLVFYFIGDLSRIGLYSDWLGWYRESTIVITYKV